MKIEDMNIASQVLINGVAITVTLQQAEQMLSNLPKEAKVNEAVLSKTAAILCAYEVWGEEEPCHDKAEEWFADYEDALYTLLSIEAGTFDYEDIPY